MNMISNRFTTDDLMRDLAEVYARGGHTTGEFLDMLERLSEDAVADTAERGTR